MFAFLHVQLKDFDFN